MNHADQTVVITTGEVIAIDAEIPAGHRHLRTTLTLADGSSITFQEATVAAIVRAYTTIKTHPIRTRTTLRGVLVAGGKPGYAEWQLLEEEP
jgi:hypothetical protein